MVNTTCCPITSRTMRRTFFPMLSWKKKVYVMAKITFKAKKQRQTDFLPIPIPIVAFIPHRTIINIKRLKKPFSNFSNGMLEAKLIKRKYCKFLRTKAIFLFNRQNITVVNNNIHKFLTISKICINSDSCLRSH